MQVMFTKPLEGQSRIWKAVRLFAWQNEMAVPLSASAGIFTSQIEPLEVDRRTYFVQDDRKCVDWEGRRVLFAAPLFTVPAHRDIINKKPESTLPSSLDSTS